MTVADGPLDVARRYFSEEPWWLEKMVLRIIEAYDPREESE